MQAVCDADYGSDAEQRKRQFARLTTKFQTECHAVVFGKVDDEPVAKNLVFLAERHVQLDPEFGKLVYQEHRGNQYEGFGIAFHRMGRKLFNTVSTSLPCSASCAVRRGDVPSGSTCRFRGRCRMFCSRCAPVQPPGYR